MRPHPGFTLLEVIIVLLITSVLAGIAIPRFSRSGEEYRVESAARRIMSDLEFAKEHARLKSNSVTMTFDLNRDEYSSTDIASIDHPGEDYLVELRTDPYRVDLTASGFVGIGTITFDGHGTPNKDFLLFVSVGSSMRSVSVGGGIVAVGSP